MSCDLNKHQLQQDPWRQLKAFTRARIAIGRVGNSLPTSEILNFDLSHAMARDAVHLALDVNALETDLQFLGYITTQVHSQAPDRAAYLLRPDWGRKLDEPSLSLLKAKKTSGLIDLLIIVGDGLSSLAVSRHVMPLLVECQKILPKQWQANHLVIASQARVAIGDEIGQTLNAKMVVMLIGERPGLSSPDSLGIYLTFNPKVGLSDANRNCISNVRPEGLQYAEAARKLVWLAQEAMRLKVTGIMLKDESDVQEIALNSSKLLT